MATMKWQPAWWNDNHASAWDRVKEAMRRDWEQTKHDLHIKGGHELNQDIGTAQAISQRNVENIVDLFSGAFNKSLKHLKAAADRAGEPHDGSHRPNRMLQSRTCILLLSTSSAWPRKVDRRLCEDAVLESIYPALTEKIRFTELEGLLRGLPLEKRMCTYQHFLRRSRLFETKPFPHPSPSP